MIFIRVTLFPQLKRQEVLRREGGTVTICIFCYVFATFWRFSYYPSSLVIVFMFI